MAYFGGYELGKLLVPPGMGMPGDMAVGAVAQVNVCTGGIVSPFKFESEATTLQLVAGAVFTPVDVVKERLQVQGMLPQLAPSGGHNPSAQQQGPAALLGGGRGPAAVQAVQALVLERGVLGLMRGYWVSDSVG